MLQTMLEFQHSLQLTAFLQLSFGQAASGALRRSRPAQAIMAATAKNRAII